MLENKWQRGFTLIEVLIALVIMAIALVAIVKATQDSVKDTIYVKDKLTANWIAMNTLSAVQVGMLAAPVRGQPLYGTVNMMGKIWNWELKAAENQASANVYFERIYVTVKTLGATTPSSRMEGYARTPGGIQLHGD